MSFFIRLIEATDQQRRQLELVPKLDRMIHKGLSKQEYISFLSDLYFIVWHFCPIMAAAAARCDDSHRQIRFYLYKNIEEEMGHDQWVLDDLRFLGSDPEAIKTQKLCAAVQAFIGYNYYYPEHVNPVGVIGMLYALEVVSSVYSGRVAHSIARNLSMKPDEGFGFLQSHSSMDLDHLANLNQLIKTIEVEEAQEAVINSTNVNFYLLRQFLAGASSGD